MSSNRFVLRVIEVLERLDIPYMLVGSYSSNAFGIARSTQDADFVIELGSRSASDVFHQLSPDLRFEPQMLFETVTMTGRYVGENPESGFKVELFQISDDVFDRERFRRRQRQPFLTTSAYLPTAEDVVIQKLRWFERGRRAKDRDDAKNVIAVQGAALDLAYIRQWCDQHGTRASFETLIEEIEKLTQ